MSRIGKKVIELPSGVVFDYNEEKRIVTIKGGLGSLTQEIQPFVSLKKEENLITVEIADVSDKFQRAMWGTTRALLNNMAVGVSKGFENKLTLSGVGFKINLQGKTLVMSLGFSHEIKVEVPEKIKADVKNNELTGSSFDKQALNHFFTKIHNLKPADVYKHKGFKFPGRHYAKKEGKKASKDK